VPSRATAAKYATARRCSASVAARSSERVLILATPGRSDGSDSAGMNEPIFLRESAGLTLDEVASVTSATMASRSPRAGRIVNIAPPDRAGPRDLTFLESRNFAAAAAGTHAGACLTTAPLAKELPNHVSVLIVREPYRAFVSAARELFPHALRPSSLSKPGDFAGAHVAGSARMEDGVSVEPGAVVGPQVEIGSGTAVGANAVIGAG